MTHFRNAQRIQTSVLAGAEKKALLWLAHRTPYFINSDHLTAIGLAAMVGTGLSYWLAAARPMLGLSLATLCLALNWLGDSLDGTLARVRNKLRPRYGFYVDHVVDMLGSLFLLAGIALSGYMSVPVAAGLLIAFFMLSMNSYLATYTLGTFRLSFGGFSPTELRVLLAIVEVGGVPEVADALGVAGTTVKTHLGRLFEKTGAGRQAELVKLVAGFSMPFVS